MHAHGGDGFGGKYYDDLPKGAKDTFLNYSISVDVLIGANDTEVLDIFARLNTYGVRLNKQELINAKYSLYCAIYDLLYGLPESATEQTEFDSQTIVRTRTTLWDIDALFEVEYELLREADLRFVEASTRRTTDLSARRTRHQYLVSRITRDIKSRST
jgi:hypothetical protein